MKTNNNPTSGKRLAQLLALCLLATFSSCDRDGTESVEFGVNVQTPDAVYAGQPVTFEFDGNPDYIAFYSGEKNDRYANRDRTTLPEVDSLGLSYSAKMQYAENYDYLGDRILRVMISDTYDGSGEINPEEWHDLTDPDPAVNEEYLKSVILETSTTAKLPYAAVNLSQYKDKDFYLAFRYLAEPHTGIKSEGHTLPSDPKKTYSYDNRPRIDVTELKLVKREPDKNLIVVEDMVREFVFTPHFVTSKVQNNFTVSNYSMMFQPQEYVVTDGKITVNESQDYDIDVWMVSQKLSPHSVEPDRGTHIKGTNARLGIYQHTYNEPGTYTATFIVTNANKWNSEQTVREVTVEVKPAQ